jgi:GH24 family phage-related lysozyme (muramidase)
MAVNYAAGYLDASNISEKIRQVASSGGSQSGLGSSRVLANSPSSRKKLSLDGPSVSLSLDDPNPSYGENFGAVSVGSVASLFDEVDAEEIRAYLKEKGLGEFAGDSNIPLDDPDLNMEGSIADIVKGFEGFKTKAYWDTDHWSIGHGTRASGKDATITLEQANIELSKELAKSKATVIRHQEKYNYNWSTNQVDALSSFVFNLGSGGLNQLTDDGTRGDEIISQKILEYNTSDGKVLGGLTKRRQAEARLFTQGYD